MVEKRNILKEIYRRRDIRRAYIEKQKNDYYNIILGVDHIIYITAKNELEPTNMDIILKEVSIPYTKIMAVKKKQINRDIIEGHINDELDSYTLACTLTHLKIISALSNFNGDYFLVLNNNINFKKNLKTIIEKSPEFDILIIQKTTIFDIDYQDSDYVNWKNTPAPIYNPSAYIISKNGIKNVLSSCGYFKDGRYIVNLTDYYLSDMIIFSRANTIIYKHNLS